MYMYVQMYTHTAQRTPVFVEIQVVQSVLMVGRKETERQVDLQGDGQHCPLGEPTYRPQGEECMTNIRLVDTHMSKHANLHTKLNVFINHPVFAGV